MKNTNVTAKMSKSNKNRCRKQRTSAKAEEKVKNVKSENLMLFRHRRMVKIRRISHKIFELLKYNDVDCHHDIQLIRSGLLNLNSIFTENENTHQIL